MEDGGQWGRRQKQQWEGGGSVRTYVPEGKQPGFNEPHVHVPEGIPGDNLRRSGEKIVCARARTQGVIIEYVDTFEPEKGQPSPQNATSFRLCTVPSNQEYFVLTTRGFSSTLIVRSTSRFPRLILNYLRATVRLYLTERCRFSRLVAGLRFAPRPATYPFNEEKHLALEHTRRCMHDRETAPWNRSTTQAFRPLNHEFM